MAVEHTMFIFDDLKVTSHDDKTDRQNNNQNTKLSSPILHTKRQIKLVHQDLLTHNAERTMVLIPTTS